MKQNKAFKPQTASWECSTDTRNPVATSISLSPKSIKSLRPSTKKNLKTRGAWHRNFMKMQKEGKLANTQEVLLLIVLCPEWNTLTWWTGLLPCCILRREKLEILLPLLLSITLLRSLSKPSSEMSLKFHSNMLSDQQKTSNSHKMIKC